ncbi:sulfatase family protein [Vagococcus fluvialis]|uniref:sulfatase family protein n=1 Tax=Vagococcus fluvialis TaxID=2738 RepID=UPI001A8D3616|nr:sulfatase-like hydrolase/transferase [Vagococcus fluvialis]MBO0438424.1 sulfatase-like hydrolase/transferase [Vagococcus fluvialis]
MGKPNVLLISSDQQHFNTLGRFNDQISTPNLDKLSNEGMTFDRAYCPNPTCTPSRASMITGKFPSQHGAWTLGTKLPEKEETVGGILNDNGYITSLIGKAHFQPLNSTEEYQSLESYPIIHDTEFWENYNQDFYGFNHIELTRNHTNESHVGQHYQLWLQEKVGDDWKQYFLPPTGTMDPKTKYKWDIPEGLHYNTWIAERTAQQLEEYTERKKPFFLWASFFDPHPEYLVPEPWDTMYEDKNLTVPKIVEGEHENNPPFFLEAQKEDADFSAYRETGYAIHGMSRTHILPYDEIKRNQEVYYGMISMMDKYIGQILTKIEDLDIEEETIVIFTSDHGHLFGQHGLNRKGPFLYEDLVKVPLIIKYPPKVKGQEINGNIASLVDLAPTILSLCGIQVPREMTGVDLTPTLEDRTVSVRNHTIIENHHEPTLINQRTYVDNRYKITVYYNQEYGELYDLEQDPNEVNNLWNDKEFQELKLQLLLKYVWAELGKEAMWMPRIAGA